MATHNRARNAGEPTKRDVSKREALIRVGRGARILDGCVPGWEQRIDPKRIDAASDRQCVLGQLFGDVSRGIDHIGVNAKGAPSRCGFRLFDREAEPSNFAMLTAMWTLHVVLLRQGDTSTLDRLLRRPPGPRLAHGNVPDPPSGRIRRVKPLLVAVIDSEPCDEPPAPSAA